MMFRGKESVMEVEWKLCQNFHKMVRDETFAEEEKHALYSQGHLLRRGLHMMFRRFMKSYTTGEVVVRVKKYRDMRMRRIFKLNDASRSSRFTWVSEYVRDENFTSSRPGRLFYRQPSLVAFSGPVTYRQVKEYCHKHYLAFADSNLLIGFMERRLVLKEIFSVHALGDQWCDQKNVIRASGKNLTFGLVAEIDHEGNWDLGLHHLGNEDEPVEDCLFSEDDWFLVYSLLV